MTNKLTVEEKYHNLKSVSSYQFSKLHAKTSLESEINLVFSAAELMVPSSV